MRKDLVSVQITYLDSSDLVKQNIICDKAELIINLMNVLIERCWTNPILKIMDLNSLLWLYLINIHFKVCCLRLILSEKEDFICGLTD